MKSTYRFRTVHLILFALAAVLCAAEFAGAQSTATVQGTVLDAQGGVVPDAKVAAKNLATGLERTTQTDSSGIFLLPSLPVGTYRLEIRHPGFQALLVNELTLEVGTKVTQTYTLKLGEVTSTVEVTSEAPLIEQSTMSVSQVINSKTVQEIPLNGRHFVDLGLLIPGSVTPPQNGFLTAPLRGQGSFAFNTAGNREDSVNFMINGINLNDQVQNQITFQPSINTVQEFKVDNSTFNAEYGRSSGAIVNIATRSGGNRFHGEGFDFVRNHFFDARNFFNPALSASGAAIAQNPFKRNQFGAALGGPIWKDRTFFFFSYEGLRQRQGITINTTVLSDPERAAATAAGNPTVLKLLPLIPPTNSGTNTFLGSAVAPVNIDQWTLDLSHNFSANDRLHGYYVFQRDLRQEPILQGNNLPGFGDTRQSHRQVFTLNEIHTFSPTVVNEARLGFNRIHITFVNNLALNPSDFGIGNGVTTPIGLPQILISSINLNFGGSTNGFPQGRGDTTGVFSDTVSWLKGRHSLKFGGEVRRFYNNNFQQFVGFFRFADVANFNKGTANQFQFTQGKAANKIVQGALGFFVMDSFKWRSNFTWELGLRYDWNKTPTEAADGFVIFNPATASLVQTGSPFHQNSKNFQPRIGFAWDPFKDGKTSVRAAYAIQVDQPITGIVLGLATNPPFATPLNISSGTITFANPIPPGLKPIAPSTIDPNYNNAYIQSYNLNVQREVTSKLGLMAGYFGSKGTHLNIVKNLNQGAPGARPFPTVSGTSAIAANSPLNNIAMQATDGNSSYNALWIAANLHPVHGLQFNASYTLSKSIDNNSLNSEGLTAGNYKLQDSNNIRNDRGLSDFDARHRFVINWIYALPFKGNRLVEGWQLSSITQWQTGNPLNIVTGNTGLTGVGSLRPDVTGPLDQPHDPLHWINSTGLSSPSTGGVLHFGNLGRNAITGPGFSNTDFSVTKNTRITESVRIQFRAELFDVFNHPNFGNPVLTLGSAVFGQIRSTRFPGGDFGSSRQAQFALKLLF
jgi:hypothetical protein